MLAWDVTEVVPPLPFSGSWSGVSQPNPFVYMSTAENSAALNEKGEVESLTTVADRANHSILAQNSLSLKSPVSDSA